MVPNRYVINVAKAGGNVRITDNSPVYYWFCTVDAGDNFDHAKKVEKVIKERFPEPQFSVVCQQKYNGSVAVNEFDWRAKV